MVVLLWVSISCVLRVEGLNGWSCVCERHTQLWDAAMAMCVCVCERAPGSFCVSGSLSLSVWQQSSELDDKEKEKERELTMPPSIGRKAMPWEVANEQQ